MGFFDDVKDSVDDAVDDAKEAVDDVVEGGGDVVDEVSDGDIGGAIDEAGDTVEDVASGSKDTGSNPSSGSSGGVPASGSSDSGDSGGITIDTGSSDSGGGGSSGGGSSSSGSSSSSNDSDYRPDKDPSELKPGESTTIEANNQNDKIEIDPIEMPDRDPSKPAGNSNDQDRFPTMPGVAVSTTVDETETEYRNRVAQARLDAQEETIKEQKQFVRNRIDERKDEVRNQYENDAIYTVDAGKLDEDVRDQLDVDTEEGTVEVSGDSLQSAYVNNLEQNREFVDQLDKDLQEVESQQETVQNTMMENDAIRERNQEIEQAREEFRKQQVADFFDKTDNTGGSGPPYNDAGSAARGLDSYFADQVDMSMQDFSENVKEGKKYGGNSAGAQLVGDFIASGETLVNQSWDAVSGTDGGFNADAFDSADVTELGGVQNLENPTRIDKRSDELGRATVGQLAGSIVGLPDLANAAVSYGGRAFGGNAAAKFFTEEENMDKVRPFTPIQDAGNLVDSQVEAAKQDPVKFGSAIGVEIIGSKGLGRAAGTASRIDAPTPNNFKTAAGRGADSFNANNINFVDRVDPRTGFGREPLPGEPTPAAPSTVAAARAGNVADFIRGDLGQRRANPDEVRSMFDESDILMGRNRPDGAAPDDPVTVDRSRLDVVRQKNDQFGDFLDQLNEDLPLGSRKGQMYMGGGPRVKVKKKVKDVDDTADDIGSVDYLTPDDRRPLDFVDDAKARIDDVRDRIDDIDTPKPDTGAKQSTFLIP